MIMDSFKNVFVVPILRTLVQPFWGQLVGGIASLASAKSSQPQQLNMDTMRGFQQPTQNIINQQLGQANEMMDPQSDLNLNMRRMMAQRASETGAQISGQARRMGAMRGVSQGQANLQQRMGMNQAMGGVNQQWLQNLMKMRGAGMGVMQNMGQMQQGLDENLGNVHMANVNMQNKNPGMGGMGGNFLTGMLGNLDMGNIGGGAAGLFGGEDGFMSNFGTGSGAMAGMFGGPN